MRDLSAEDAVTCTQSGKPERAIARDLSARLKRARNPSNLSPGWHIRRRARPQAHPESPKRYGNGQTRRPLGAGTGHSLNGFRSGTR